MNAPTKLAAFAAAIAVAFVLGLGLGQVAGPFEDERPAPTTPTTSTHGTHGLGSR